MDVDGPREVRRRAVVEPVVVGEPRVGFGDGDKVAGALVRDADASPARPCRAPARLRESSRGARGPSRRTGSFT